MQRAEVTVVTDRAGWAAVGASVSPFGVKAVEVDSRRRSGWWQERENPAPEASARAGRKHALNLE